MPVCTVAVHVHSSEFTDHYSNGLVEGGKGLVDDNAAKGLVVGLDRGTDSRPKGFRVDFDSRPKGLVVAFDSRPKGLLEMFDSRADEEKGLVDARAEGSTADTKVLALADESVDDDDGKSLS